MKLKSGYVYILLTALIFSTMEIALKMVGGAIAPMQITVLRFLAGGLLLIPFAVISMKKKKAILQWMDWGYFIFLGFLCVVLSMVLYQMAVVHTKASVVAILYCSNSIFVSILAFFLLRERIYKNNVFALILELLGILSIMKPWDPNLNLEGVLMAVVSAVIFSLYGVIGRRKTVKYGSIAVTCLSFLCGGVELLLLILVGRIPIVAKALAGVPALGIFANVPIFSGITLSTLPVLLYICVVGSAGGFVCYMLSMETTSANETALVFFIKPVLAPILAYFLIHEVITWNIMLGILFFLVGSLVSVVPAIRRSRAMEPNTSPGDNHNQL